MKQIYHHYETWEDYQAGMYDEDKNDREKRIKKAIRLLSSEALCSSYMMRVIKEWKNACEQIFTSPANHRSFLGQAACCLYAGVHEDETRKAWGMLPDDVRKKANHIADSVYEQWLIKNDPDYLNHQHDIFQYLTEREMKMKKEIKTYKYNDPELLKTIIHLLGSTEWVDEHEYSLIRYKTKTFHLLFVDGKFVSMFSENKNSIGDCHTEPQYRNKGYMKYLLNAFDFKTGTRATTKNKIMIKLFEQMGFTKTGTRGKFTIYKKVD